MQVVVDDDKDAVDEAIINSKMASEITHHIVGSSTAIAGREMTSQIPVTRPQCSHGQFYNTPPQFGNSVYQTTVPFVGNYRPPMPYTTPSWFRNVPVVQTKRQSQAGKFDFDKVVSGTDTLDNEMIHPTSTVNEAMVKKDGDDSTDLTNVYNPKDSFFDKLCGPGKNIDSK